MKYLHHTNWNLEAISYPFDSSTPSGNSCSYYWQNKVIKKLVPIKVTAKGLSSENELLLTLLTLRNALPALLEEYCAEQNYDFESWAQKINGELGRLEVEKEVLFEDVREKNFGDLPSRMRSIFLIESNQNINEHMNAMEFDIIHRAVLEIQPLESSRLVKVDSSWLDCNLSFSKIEYARKYWSSEINDPSKCEILLEGPYQITRRVR